jgi:hypothetical protein
MFCEADYAMETPNPDIQTQSSSPEWVYFDDRARDCWRYQAGEGAGFIGAIVGAIIVLVVWGMIAPRLERT